jgi:uncharacterized protein
LGGRNWGPVRAARGGCHLDDRRQQSGLAHVQEPTGFIDVVIEPFNARLESPLVPTVRALYTDRDMVIAFFDAAGVAKDGKPYNNTYTWYLRMRDGAIVEVVAFFDTIEFTDFWTRVSP